MIKKAAMNKGKHSPIKAVISFLLKLTFISAYLNAGFTVTNIFTKKYAMFISTSATGKDLNINKTTPKTIKENANP
ncbi:hypothetical protein AGMMS50293_27060 [Spirochaetia bacterium]|nr:hypothetical protein AGMMS50293_27060 [Spirochaetia bacterium]